MRSPVQTAANRRGGLLCVLAGLLLLAGAACSGGSDSEATSDGWFRLQLEADQGVDLAAATRIAIAVTGPGLSFSTEHDYPSEEFELDVPLGLDRVFDVRLISGTGGTVARGTSEPEDLVEGTFTTVIVILKEPA